MSADADRAYEGSSTGWDRGSGWRGCRRGQPWRPVELLAMILGFIVFWPIGLGVLLWKVWQRKTGYQGDIVAFGREKWENSANWSWACGRGGSVANPWRGFASTGNQAFDDWRAAELARLEEERQMLVQAEREFAEYMDNLRRARDREEFDRFMNERRNRQGPTTSV